MKKKGLFSIILLVSIVFSLTGLKAQEVLEGVYVKNHTASRKPVPYQYLREADVMWSKTVWRVIELKEKINFPLYYPTSPIGERKSLIDLLMWGISNQGLTAYKYSLTDEFASVMTMKDIEEGFDAIDKVEYVDDLENPGEQIEVKIPGEIKTKEIKQFLVKELWFFDKQRSVMEVRIIGLCPVRFYEKGGSSSDPNADPNADPSESLSKKMVFWVYFPEARKLLANHEVFNPANDAERMSYDDLFFKRKFSSYIYQESNAYDNRPISEYTMGLESLLEAERIKESIFNYEQDLWEY
jgi:gliding motility associated protien GldN